MVAVAEDTTEVVMAVEAVVEEAETADHHQAEDTRVGPSSALRTKSTLQDLARRRRNKISEKPLKNTALSRRST